MVNFVSGSSRAPRMTASQCTDPVIGDILSGWRYDISGLSPAMRTDYDQHLSEPAPAASRSSGMSRAPPASTFCWRHPPSPRSPWPAFLLAAVILHRHRGSRPRWQPRPHLISRHRRDHHLARSDRDRRHRCAAYVPLDPRGAATPLPGFLLTSPGSVFAPELRRRAS